MIKIGILREGKIPPDRRVALTPLQCKKIKDTYPEIKLLVQPSSVRCYSDQEYADMGIELKEDVSECDILIGIKEVPVDNLISDKKYFFFSHTIKSQPHNKKLMKALINKNIQMIDYETLVDENNNRLIGFGHYAGIVGAYNGLRAYGIKNESYSLKPAHLCFDKKELIAELNKIKLSSVKIIVTGNGRVANGAIELLGLLDVRRITPFEFVHKEYKEPTYTQLHSNDYNEHSKGLDWSRSLFYKHPDEFISVFNKFYKHCDLLMHCSYWDPRAPKLFSKEEMKRPDFKIRVIADITCDIDGSIPSTTQPSSIDQPFYGYDPNNEKITEPFLPGIITVMAVDNLPCELPRDASENFGKELTDIILKPILENDPTGVLERATICNKGRLMPRFNYLNEYAFS